MLRHLRNRWKNREQAHKQEKDNLKTEVGSLQWEIRKLNRQLAESRTALPRDQICSRETEDKRALYVDESHIEIRVRNEVAAEFKREIDKMRQLYADQSEEARKDWEGEIKGLREQVESKESLALELAAKLKEKESELHDVIQSKENIVLEIEQKQLEQLKQLEESCRASEDKIKQLERDLKVANNLAEYRSSLVIDIENELKKKELELLEALEENKSLRRLSESPTEKSKASRIRAKPQVIDEDLVSYANMTFDGGDEIAQVSAKKTKRKVGAGTRKRAINQSIMLSGKKKKLKNNDEEAELSPLITARVTRSRAATKRKLDY